MNSKARILVVDDEVSITRSVRLNLAATGSYEVRTENDSRQAIKTAREFKPDLMLLDVMMPGLSGSEVAAQLRDDPALRATPVVFMTAIVAKSETKGAEVQIAGNTFVAKPVDLAELKRVIEAHRRR